MLHTPQGRTVLAPNAASLRLSEGWPAGAAEQAEIMVEIEVAACAFTLELNVSGLVCFVLEYTPPTIGVAHTAVVSAMCGDGDDRCGSPGNPPTNETLALTMRDDVISLRLFTDQWLSEAYWQGGRVATTVPSQFGALTSATEMSISATTATAAGFVGEEAAAATSTCEVALRSVRAWRVGGIWVSPEDVLKPPE